MNGWLGVAAWVWVLVLALGLAIVGVGLVLLRRAGRSSEGAGPGVGRRPDALAILDERLARGEIDATEHERRRRVLGER